MENLLLFIETKDNEPKKACLELLSEAKRLKNDGKFKIHAVVMGKPSEDLKNKVQPYVDILVSMSDPVLDQYTPEGYAAALAAYSTEIAPKLILSSATQLGRDFMPRVAVLLRAGIASDITAVDWSKDPITFVRPVYGGKVLSEISFVSYPGIVTVRPNAFVKEEAGTGDGSFVEKQSGIDADKIKTKVLNISDSNKKKVDLIEADIIIAGGRGLKSAENFRILEDLADVVDGAVGASRSVVDAKWRDQEDQVGKSGKTVSPKLYIAAGISGAVHHTMGMDTSKIVVAINNDPNAIIFDYADYGIVGDFTEVVPCMTEEFKKRLDR